MILAGQIVIKGCCGHRLDVGEKTDHGSSPVAGHRLEKEEEIA
jgi:hypothetical protein